jgi:hypothetical protein
MVVTHFKNSKKKELSWSVLSSSRGHLVSEGTTFFLLHLPGGGRGMYLFFVFTLLSGCLSPLLCAFQFNGDQDFATSVQSNAQRYVELFGQAIDTLLGEHFAHVEPAEEKEDVIDVLLKHRLTHAKQAMQEGEDGGADVTEAEVRKLFPSRLLRR